MHGSTRFHITIMDTTDIRILSDVNTCAHILFPLFCSNPVQTYIQQKNIVRNMNEKKVEIRIIPEIKSKKTEKKKNSNKTTNCREEKN